MGVKLVSASAGSVEIVAPTTASNYTATMPAGTGNVVVNGINSSIVSGTSLAYNWNGLTTNTSLDFTSIPSWVKRITVMFVNTSTSGSSNILLQLGSGSATITGYVSTYLYVTGSSASAVTATNGFVIPTTSASDTKAGAVIFSLSGSNTWVGSGSTTNTATSACSVSGLIALAGTLDRVRITTANGTDTFDAGSINILYE